MLGLAQKQYLNHSPAAGIAGPRAPVHDTSKWPLLEKLAGLKRLAYVDYALSEMLMKGFTLEDESVAALICHLSSSVRQGHVCIHVDDENVFPDPCTSWKEMAQDLSPEDMDCLDDDLHQIKRLIQRGAKRLPSCLATDPENQDGAFLYKKGPLIYFQKYWHYESQLVEHFNAMGQWKPQLLPDGPCFHKIVQGLVQEGRLLPEQADAILASTCHCLTIIAGGPGTGKTYTAGVLIKAFWESLNEQQRRKCEIALAAPTGKAASNLQGSLIKAMGPDGPLQRVKAKTLHSLLGVKRRKAPQASSNILSADLIVVDECSMIDVKLMSSLFGAIKPGARLILLGDGHQLPAVEAGSVFADLIQAASQEARPIVYTLKKCLRAELKDIIDFAQLVNDGDADNALRQLNGGSQNGVCRVGLSDHDASTAGIQNALAEIAEKKFRDAVLDAEAPEKHLDLFNAFRILSPLRQGPFGVDALNQRILKQMKACSKPGRPFIAPVILVNSDHRLELFNGETGILVRNNMDGDDHSLRSGDYVLFPAKDGSQTARRVPALLLPKFEYAYCLSVHKSQGSEFGHVLLMLPQGSEFFGREVLYTAATRAKKRLDIWSEDDVLEATILNKSQRLSGIAPKLMRSILECGG